jgi:maltose alpha-D-glucosyltransferase/alpha-amylase
VAPASEQALLDLFLIEKAAYEIRYEAANRPTWLSLPVRGLAALASRLLGDTGMPHDPSAHGSAGATPPNPAEGDYE